MEFSQLDLSSNMRYSIYLGSLECSTKEWIPLHIGELGLITASAKCCFLCLECLPQALFLSDSYSSFSTQPTLCSDLYDKAILISF